MLEIRNANVSYGKVPVLRDISLEVHAGEIVSLVGANAAGKSTTLNTISGLVRPTSGELLFEGQRIDRLAPHRIVELGIIQVPEGRQLFPFMTVLENLELGAFSPKARQRRRQSLDLVFELFPVLKDRRPQLAASLSGGEQQMCAIGRALMALPRLLMLDEPSLGLAPLLVQKMFAMVSEINARGTTILLVEQNVTHALRMATRGYVLETGRITLSGDPQGLLKDEHLRRAFLGM